QRAGRGKTTQWKKSKKSYYLKQKELGFPDPDWDIGKRGFKRPQDIVRIYQINTINVKDLDQSIENFVLNKKATKTGNTYNIDLNNINVQKILGRGKINKRINITVNKASKKAIEKIEEAGGKLTFLSQVD
ncbi:MAG: uL15m family ribosomal protein, partial [Candidatus Hodarchaeota archaeon]